MGILAPCLRPQRNAPLLLSSEARPQRSLLRTPPILTWWFLHCFGPRAPPSAGRGPWRGAGEALPDVLLATMLLAWRPWRLERRTESSVDFCSGTSLRMLFIGLGRKAKKSTYPRPALMGPWRLWMGTCLLVQPENFLGSHLTYSIYKLGVQWALWLEYTHHGAAQTISPLASLGPPLPLREKPTKLGIVSLGHCLAPPHRSTDAH